MQDDFEKKLSEIAKKKRRFPAVGSRPHPASGRKCPGTRRAGALAPPWRCAGIVGFWGGCRGGLQAARGKCAVARIKKNPPAETGGVNCDPYGESPAPPCTGRGDPASDGGPWGGPPLLRPAALLRLPVSAAGGGRLRSNSSYGSTKITPQPKLEEFFGDPYGESPALFPTVHWTVGTGRDVRRPDELFDSRTSAQTVWI